MSLDKQTLDELRIDRATRRSAKPPIAVVVAALLVLLLGGLLFWWLNRPKPAMVRTVLIHETGGGHAHRTLLNASGYVTARREATVSSKVTGKVVEVLVEEGMKVEAGQVLAKLDSSNVEKSLHLAEAQLESARKAMGEIEANLKRADNELRRRTE